LGVETTDRIALKDGCPTDPLAKKFPKGRFSPSGICHRQVKIRRVEIIDKLGSHNMSQGIGMGVENHLRIRLRARGEKDEQRICAFGLPYDLLI
jgi:hypothetical protein